MTTSFEVKTPDGTMLTHLHTPSGHGPHPAVVLYVDAFGVRGAMHEMAQKIADDGYAVALPNVFYRAGDFAPFNVKTAFNDPKERERLMGMMKQATPAAVMRDTGALLDALAARAEVKQGPVGTTGYCMGGRLSFVAAGTFGDRVGAAASFHGGHLVADGAESPHTLASKMRARIYLGVADNDQSCTPAHQGALATALGEAHLRYAIELYQGKGHGFAVPDSSAYDAGASAHHYAVMRELFAELKPR
jgi:carboxymethylenebutenolidase